MAGYPAHDHQLRGHDYRVLHRCEQCGSRLPVDAAVTIQHGACRMQGGGANPDWIRLTCILLPREAGLTTARLAFSFTAESASLDENTPFHHRGFPSIHFWGSGCIVANSSPSPVCVCRRPWKVSRRGRHCGRRLNPGQFPQPLNTRVLRRLQDRFYCG
jgi:hypothetical protein